MQRRPSIVLRYWFFPGLPLPCQSATQPLPKSSLKQTPGLCGCASSPLDDAQRRRPVAASCSNDRIRVSRHDDFLCTVAYAALGKSRDALEKACPPSASLSAAACAASSAECPLRHTNVSTIPSSNRFRFVLMVLCRTCIACREIRYRDEHQPLRRLTMSIIDKALGANRNYAKTYDPTNANRPAPKS